MSFQATPSAKVSIKGFFRPRPGGHQKISTCSTEGTEKKEQNQELIALGLLCNVRAFSELLMDITKFTLNLTPAAENPSLLAARVNKGISFHITQI